MSTNLHTRFAEAEAEISHARRRVERVAQMGRNTTVWWERYEAQSRMAADLRERISAEENQKMRERT